MSPPQPFNLLSPASDRGQTGLDLSVPCSPTLHSNTSNQKRPLDSEIDTDEEDEFGNHHTSVMTEDETSSMSSLETDSHHSGLSNSNKKRKQSNPKRVMVQLANGDEAGNVGEQAALVKEEFDDASSEPEHLVQPVGNHVGAIECP